MDDADPMVSVMKLEKAPEETYADIGGLDTQIQEIKVYIYMCMYMCNTLLLIMGIGTHTFQLLRANSYRDCNKSTGDKGRYSYA